MAWAPLIGGWNTTAVWWTAGSRAFQPDPGSRPTGASAPALEHDTRHGGSANGVPCTGHFFDTRMVDRAGHHRVARGHRPGQRDISPSRRGARPAVGPPRAHPRLRAVGLYGRGRAAGARRNNPPDDRVFRPALQHLHGRIRHTGRAVRLVGSLHRLSLTFRRWPGSGAGPVRHALDAPPAGCRDVRSPGPGGGGGHHRDVFGRAARLADGGRCGGRALGFRGGAGSGRAPDSRGGGSSGRLRERVSRRVHQACRSSRYDRRRHDVYSAQRQLGTGQQRRLRGGQSHLPRPETKSEPPRSYDNPERAHSAVL